MAYRSRLCELCAVALLFAFAGGLGRAARAAAPDEGIRQSAALAISGGASKGAYEAGLNWATIALLRSSANARQLAVGGDITTFDMVSIAGTSAGGINTLLSGLAWCVRPEQSGGFPNRIDDNIFRDTWLAPDINNLLPPAPDSPPYLPDDAALSRQAFVDVAADLQKKWSRPGTFRSDCMVPLGVTVTRTVPAELVVDGIPVANQRFYIPFEIRAQADASAAFFFDPADYPELRDPTLILLPRTPDTAPHSVSGQQVVEAVFATSAFPTGFSRRRLAYCQLGAFFGTSSPSEALTRSGLVCPQGYELAEGEFADGGLFDNLPLGLARKLAEERSRGSAVALPVEYIYVDPNRLRFQPPERKRAGICADDNASEACRAMEYSIGSELAVVGGFLGTARKYALYDELTSDVWRLSLAGLSERLADVLDANDPDPGCPSLQRYFEGGVGCAQAVRRAGRFLKLAYDYDYVPVIDPLSGEALREAGIAGECRPSPLADTDTVSAECTIDLAAYRRQLAAALVEIAAAAGPDGRDLVPSIERSARSVYNDRHILVTSLGAPINGQLLGAFGAFLDYKFREYDYYVGVYDAIATVSRDQCALRFSADEQGARALQCIDLLSEQLYQNLGVAADSRGRYVFALLARREFGDDEVMDYAYTPMPAEDRDMRIIHDGLEEVLLKGSAELRETADEVFVERVFFDYLRDHGFEPTPSPDGGEPLLSLIVEDPENWPYELTKRWTTRLVVLEREAAQVFEDREPDPKRRQIARTGTLGAAAWGLQTATYKYPGFAFAPSTAPEAWIWRNVIPYEVAFDLVEGDLVTLWQPTWNLRRKTNLGLRFGFGFAGGLLRSTAEKSKKNYGTAGLDVTFLTRSTLFSSYGFTPGVYHAWTDPEIVDQTTFGFDLHLGSMKNRLRLGLGVRDVANLSDTWFLTLGVADLPGMLYWMTR